MCGQMPHRVWWLNAVQTGKVYSVIVYVSENAEPMKYHRLKFEYVADAGKVLIFSDEEKDRFLIPNSYILHLLEWRADKEKEDGTQE